MGFVRIIILNYNSAQYTIDLLGMLRSQEYQQYEIVVVDNASKEADQALLKAGLTEDIYYVTSQVNLGYSGGNNLGMRLNTANEIDYFLVLNDDVIIEDSKFLNKMLDGFQVSSDKEIIAISPLVDTILTKKPVGEQIQVRKLLPVFKMYLISFTLINRLFKSWFAQFIYQSDAPYNGKLLMVDTINGAAFMVKADFMKRNNYLDEGVFLFHEELILGKQIQNAGGTCLLNGLVSLKHLQGVSTASNKKQFNTKMERYKYISEVYLYKKYYHLNAVSLSLFSILKEAEIFLKRIIFSIK